MASAPENAVEAAILLVDAAFSGTRTLPAGTADQIAALLPEATQQGRDDALMRAESLAAAMEGDHERASALLAQVPQAAPEVWELSATTMEEELFLEKALDALAGESPRPKPETVSNIAERLMQAGFASEALSWMAALPTPLREEHLLFVAEAHLSLRQAPQALAALTGMTSPEADTIRAKIFLQLGEPASAAQIYARAGALEETQRANLIAGDYGAIAEIGTPLWRDVAAMAVTDPTIETEGPLARAQEIGESSATLRQSVERLLTAVPPPADP